MLSSNEIYIQDLQSALCATVKAICGRGDIEIIFGKDPPRAVGGRIYMPIPSFSPEDNFAQTLWRGQSDRLAVKLAFHDTVTEARYRPSIVLAAELYHKILRLYSEKKGIEQYRGIAHNIKSVYQNIFSDLGDNFEKCDKQDFYFYLILYDYIPFLFIPPQIQALEKFLNLQSRVFLEHLTALKQAGDFQEFAMQASALCLFLYQDKSDSDISQSGDRITDDNLMSGEKKTSDDVATEISQDNFLDSMAVPSGDMFQEGDISASQTEINNYEFSADDFMTLEEEDFHSASQDYKIFTKEFDVIIPAEKICHFEEKKSLFGELTRASKDYKYLTKKLAAKLRAKLMATQLNSSQNYLYDGLIDPTRLSGLIINPTEEAIFKEERHSWAYDTVVTLLIDNSGSMRGRPMTIAAISTDIIADTLEKCGVKVEILGFTTLDWKGGKSRKKWEQAGCPPMAGRLNDLHHIIYKSAHTSWKKSKDNMGILLKETLLKENIDGEALLWAYNRVMKYTQRRKILMVISDGAPVDDSTFHVNDSGFLERHLQNIIHFIENKSAVELLAIGIGHDVTRYYKRAITIRNIDILADIMTQSFMTLFNNNIKKTKKI